MQYAFSAHRAVVDVDVELGLVKVVALDTAQDVGKAINPDAVVGQIQGGSAQGMGLALMEEIVVTDGHVRNPSFTDYLIPTILDMPPMRIEVLEYADPHAPYGVRGVGEPPTISSGPAVAAAIRAATGKALRRVPVRPGAHHRHLTDLARQTARPDVRLSPGVPENGRTPTCPACSSTAPPWPAAPTTTSSATPRSWPRRPPRPATASTPSTTATPRWRTSARVPRSEGEVYDLSYEQLREVLLPGEPLGLELGVIELADGDGRAGDGAAPRQAEAAHGGHQRACRAGDVTHPVVAVTHAADLCEDRTTMCDVVLRARRAVVDGTVRPAAVLVDGERIAAVLPFDAPGRRRRGRAGRRRGAAAGARRRARARQRAGPHGVGGLRHATRAAAAGGITTIVDMPLNSLPPTVDVAALEIKRKAADGQCTVDVAFWGGAVPGNLGELRALHEAGVAGFKCFLIDSGVPEFPAAASIPSRRCGRSRRSAACSSRTPRTGSW